MPSSSVRIIVGSDWELVRCRFSERVWMRTQAERFVSSVRAQTDGKERRERERRRR